MRKLLNKVSGVAIATAFLLGFTAIVAFGLVTSDAVAGGRSGGKVTGTANFEFTGGGGHVVRCQFLVQERGGDPAKGMVNCEWIDDGHLGWFWEADVLCAKVYDEDPPYAEFAIEIVNTDDTNTAWKGFWFIEGTDGGEPSVGLDEFLISPLSPTDKGLFCGWAAGIFDDPELQPVDVEWRSIGGGNMQVHLK